MKAKKELASLQEDSKRYMMFNEKDGGYIKTLYHNK